MTNRTRRATKRVRPELVERATRPIIQALEPRRLLSENPWVFPNAMLGAEFPNIADQTFAKVHLHVPAPAYQPSWSLNWGDGSAPQTLTGASAVAHHKYAAPGNYNISAVLTVLDDEANPQSGNVTGLTFDAAFGSAGSVLQNLGGDANDRAYGIATLPNNRLLTVGQSLNQFTVQRMLPNGALDPTFAGNGRALTSFGSQYTARAAAAAEHDVKYIVAGDVHSAAGLYDFALARYNGDGTLDPSFGDAGKKITSFDAVSARANAMTILPDGGIIVAGFAGQDFAVAKYTPNGDLDESWQNGGKATYNFGSQLEIAYGVGIDNDGRIVLVGRNTADVVVVRLHADGTTDNNFGTNGVQTINLGTGDYAYNAAFDDQGRIYLAAQTNAHFTVVRLLSTGALDNAFNQDGIAELSDFGDSYARNVMVTDKGIVAAGGGHGFHRVARFKASDGNLDTTFGDGGKATRWIGAPDNGYFSALGAWNINGRLLSMGGSGANFVLGKYLADNRLGVHYPGAFTGGGFETPVVSGLWQTFNQGESLGPWTVESGSVEIVRNFWQQVQGAQSVDLAGYSSGAVYQDIQTVPGRKYLLRYALSGNHDHGGVKRVRVDFGNQFAGQPSFDTAGNTWGDMRWRYEEHEVIATSELTRLKFTDASDDSSAGAIIDDVQLIPMNVLANGGFEAASTPTGWTATGPLTIGHDTAGTVSPEGVRWLSLGDAGSVYQDLTLHPGQKYRLKFAASGQSGEIPTEPKVWWDDRLIAAPLFYSEGVEGGPDWTYFEYTVTAPTDGTARLKFEGSDSQLVPPEDTMPDWIDDISLVPLVKPVPATNLKTDVFSDTRIDLTWEDNSGDESAFIISISTDNQTFTPVGTTEAGATSFSVPDLDPNTRYWFNVSADNNGQPSPPSQSVETITDVEPVEPEQLIGLGTWTFNADGTMEPNQPALPTLADGITYRFTATSDGPYALQPLLIEGEYNPYPTEPNLYGDAEYSYEGDATSNGDTNEDTKHDGTDVKLAITGGIQGSIPLWGEFNPTHAYTRDVVGDGQTLAAVYQDADMQDNFGRIYLQVQQVAPRVTSMKVEDTAYFQNRAQTGTPNTTLHIGTDTNSVEVDIHATLSIDGQFPPNVLWAVADPASVQMFGQPTQSGVLASNGQTISLTIGNDTNSVSPNIATIGVGVDANFNGILEQASGEVHQTLQVQIMKLDWLQVAEASVPTNSVRTPAAGPLKLIETEANPARFTISIGRSPTDSGTGAYFKWRIAGDGVERSQYTDGSYGSHQGDFWHGDPAVTARSLNGQKTFKVHVGFDRDLSTKLDDNEVLKTVEVEVTRFDEIYMKRDIESSDVYHPVGEFPEYNGGSVGQGDRYDFKIHFDSASAPNPGLTKWELVHITGLLEPNFLLGIGSGASFQMTLPTEGRHRVHFWYDSDNDDEKELNEPGVYRFFDVRAYHVINLTVAQSSLRAPVTNAQVDGIFSEMGLLATVRDGPTDRRAAVRFVRNGNVGTWNPAPGQRDLIRVLADNTSPDLTDLVANVGANFHLVRDYPDSPNTLGLSYPRMNAISVKTNRSVDWFHELLHGTGFSGHRNDNNNALHEFDVGAGNLINDAERLALESAVP